MTHLANLIESVAGEQNFMQLAVSTNNYELVEYHASRLINLAGEIRRECFLATHTSGEVKCGE